MSQRRITHKEVRDMVKLMKKRGWYIDRFTGHDHIKMAHPRGWTTILPGTPSDRKWVVNKLAELDRLERTGCNR